MTMKLALIATALAGSMLVPAAATAPAEARTVVLQRQGAGAAPVWNGNRGGGWNRGGYYGGYRGGYYGRHGYGWGGAALGFGTGLLLGGALAAPPPVYYGPQPAYDDAVAYCIQRFRSYDPASGT